MLKYANADQNTKAGLAAAVFVSDTCTDNEHATDIDRHKETKGKFYYDRER